MQTKTHSLLTRCTAFILVLAMSALLTLPVLASGDDDTIHVGSVSDLKELAKNCALDTWSTGKTVSLDTDLDLTGTGFSMIPTFGGTFEGNGHTISGFVITDQLAPAGLFGWVSAGGTIRNLNVEGAVTPDGDRTAAGGIVGRNYGTVEACTFSGNVTGLKQVGGIVGVNEEGSVIQNCSVEGSVSARNGAGGIAGENHGSIVSCTNRSSVNTTLQKDEDKDTLEKISQRFQSLIQNGTIDTENLSMDIGGITGYSDGTVTSCVNEGEVGYQYVGYNVGGIVGRSEGLIVLCTNHGMVQGRKDVGGIAGQAEPDLELNLSAGTLQQLSDALDELKNLVDGAADNVDADSDELHNTMEQLNNYLSQAADSANTMYDGITDFADDAADEAQRVADILDESIDRIKKIKDDAQPAIDNMDGTLDKLSKILYQLAVESGVAAVATGTLTAASFTAKSSVSTLEDALGLLQSGASLMIPKDLSADASTVAKAYTVAKQLLGLANVIKALASINSEYGFGSNLGLALSQLWNGMQGQGSSIITLDQLTKIYGALFGSAGLTAEQAAQLVNQLSNAANSLNGSANTLGVLNSLLAGLNSASTLSGLSNIAGSLSTLIDAMPDLKSALSLAGVSLGVITVDAAGLGITLAQLGKLTSTLAESIDMAQPAIDEAKDLIDYWADQPDIHIPRVDQSVRDSGDTLLSSFTGVTEQVADLSEKAHDLGGDLTDQVRKISDQTSVITDLLIDALDKASNPDASNYFHDISDETAQETAPGQILRSENDGKISGDSNVGGIAGTQGIEAYIDPDDDLGELSLGGFNGVYESRAILRECTNSGVVTARKGTAGGIAGQETLGMIDSCYGYGSIESEEGSEVGGIAGLSSGSIKNSWAKCFLTGETYVGGIVGKGEENDALGVNCTVSDSRAMVDITGAEQYYGAIAGESTGDYSGNVFVSDELNGLDYRSVTGAAEPVTYEDLLNLENVPDAFRTMTLSFVVDDEVLKSVTFDYGASFGSDVWPEAPAQEGNYVKWDKTDLSNLHFDTVVTAEYMPYVTTLASTDIREDERAVFYVEGDFTDEDALATASEEVSEETLNALQEDSKTSENAEQWTLTIPEDGASTHTVRYLPASGSASNIAVFQVTDSGLTKLSSKVSGSYVNVEVEGNEAKLVFCEQSHFIFDIWIVVIAAGIVALTVGGIRGHKKKVAAKKAAQAGGAPADPSEVGEVTVSDNTKE